MHHLAGLVLNRSNNFRQRIRRHRREDAAKEIEVARALSIDNMATLAAH